MGLGRDIAVLGVRLEASQAIGEAAKLDRSLDRVSGSAKGAEIQVKKVERELKELSAELDHVTASLSPAERAIQSYARSTGTLDRALKANLITQREHAEYTQLAKQQFQEAGNAAGKMGTDLRTAFRAAGGVITFKALGDVIEAANERWGLLNSTAGEFVGSLGEIATAIGRLDPAALGAALGKAIGTGIVATGELIDRLGGAMSESELAMERQRNVARILASEGYDVTRMSVEQLDRAYQSMLSNRRDLSSEIYGADPSSLITGAKRFAQDLQSSLSTGGIGEGGRYETVSKLIREQLDLLDRYGAEAPAELQRVATAFGVLSTAQTRAAEASKKEDERSRRAAEAARREFDATLKRLDPYGEKLRSVAEDQQFLAEAIRDGAIQGPALDRALAGLDDRLKELGPKLEKTVEDWMDFGDAAAKALREIERDGGLEIKVPIDTYIDPVLDDQGKAIQKQIDFNKFMTDAVGIANAIGAAIGNWNSELGYAIQAAAQLAEQIYAISQQSSMSAGQGAMAGLGVGMAVGGMGQQFGLWKGDRGRSKFGGKRSGDYGDVGAAVGGMIGGVIGTVIMPGVGTAIGAAIGAVIGGVLGGAIKRGADEGLAQIKIAAGQASVEITKDEGGLGDVAGGIGDSIVDAVREISTAIGGSLQTIGPIGIKIRDDVVSVFVNGIVGRFEEVGDAISFAVTEALKTAEISGLDPMMKAALQGTKADSLEQLQADLEAVQTVIGFGIGDVGQAARAAGAELDYLRQRMVELLGNSEELGRALANINQEELNRWSDLRDSITGRQKTKAEQLQELQAKAEIFNAEKALRILELEARYAQLQAQRDQVAAEIELRRTELEANRGFLGAKGSLLEQEIGMNGTYVDAMSKITGVSLANLDAQLKALGALIGGLSKIPDINPGEIKLGGAFGGIGKKIDKTNGELEAIRRLQAKLVTSELNPGGIGSRLDAARLEYERLAAKTEASGFKKPAAGLADAADLYLDLFRSAYGATGGGYASLWGQINDLLSKTLTKNGIAPVKSMPSLKEQQEGQAAAFSKTFKRDGGGNLLMFDSKNEKRLASVESLQTQTRNRIDKTNEYLAELVAQGRTTSYSGTSTTSAQSVRRGA